MTSEQRSSLVINLYVSLAVLLLDRKKFIPDTVAGAFDEWLERAAGGVGIDWVMFRIILDTLLDCYADIDGGVRYSVDEVAEMYGVDQTAIRNWVGRFGMQERHEGDISSFTTEGVVRIGVAFLSADFSGTRFEYVVTRILCNDANMAKEKGILFR